MSEDTAERRIGTTLQGKWTLEKLLGTGGMASVYLGRHKIGRFDAIKILHAHIASSDVLRARFEQEAHAVNSFQHKGAVEIRDIDISEDGAPFLVMELLEGESLSELVRRTGPLAPDRMLRIADETLDVLAAAHARGIIHRDIKPDNLFIQKDGSVKVLDFGIARLLEGSGGKKYKTKTGTTLGTATYMAPEQARGIAELDGRADIYAVGATMFRVLTNRRVHEADTQVELLMKLVSEPAPKLASVAPNMPAPLCAVIDRALSFDRKDRYPDAKAMQADVRAALNGAMPVPVKIDEAPPTVVPAAPVVALPPPTVAKPAPIVPAPMAPPAVAMPEPRTAATMIASPSPADIRASAPSLRQPAGPGPSVVVAAPPTVAVPEVATAVRPPPPQEQRPFEIFGIRLTPLVIIAAASVALFALVGVALLAVVVLRAIGPTSPSAVTPSSEAPPVFPPPPPVTTSQPTVGTTPATAASTGTGPPGHAKGKHGK
jgi:serine/threonine-protein kinase